MLDVDAKREIERANRTPKASTMPPPWAPLKPTVSRHTTMPGKNLDEEFKKVPNGLAAAHAIALVVFRDCEKALDEEFDPDEMNDRLEKYDAALETLEMFKRKYGFTY